MTTERFYAIIEWAYEKQERAWSYECIYYCGSRCES